MKRSFSLISCLILLIKGFALEPCQTFILNASLVGDSPTIDGNGNQIYRSLDQLTNELASPVATNQACRVFSVIVHPGDYNVTYTVSFNATISNYSLSFRRAITMEKDPVIFHFHQACMTFTNFNSLDFQDIQFSFDAKLTNFSNLVISKGTEFNITNVVTKETQQNSGGYPRIDVTLVAKTTISNFSVSSLQSFRFISVKGQQNNSLKLSNISIEYAFQSKPKPILSFDSYFLFASLLENLSATNISVRSIQSETNSSREVVIYNPAIFAEQVSNISITGLSISLNANLSSNLFAMRKGSTVLLTDVNLTSNTLHLANYTAIFAINTTNSVTLSNISINETNMALLDIAPCSIFQINSPDQMGNNITIDGLVIAGSNVLQDTKVLNITGEFRNINISNVSISDLSMTSGVILSADMHHYNEDALFKWFEKRTVSILTLDNFKLQSLSLSETNIFLFQHTVEEDLFVPYLTYGEGVIAQLTNITVESFDLSGPRSSLIVFRDVKGIISNSSFFSSNFSNQSLISVTPTSSLIMDNLTLDQIDFRENANFITIEGTNFFDYNGSQLSINSTGDASLQENFMVYRVFSIQNSRFQNVAARSTVISSSHPYVYVVNNSFTNISLSNNGALGRFWDDFPDDKKFWPWNMTNEVDSFENQLIGQEFTSVSGILKTSSENMGFCSLFYKNEFQSVTIDHGNLIRLEKYDLKQGLLDSEESDNSNFVVFKSNNLSNFSISSIQELPLLQFSTVNTAIIEDNDFQLLTNMSGIFEVSKTEQESASSSSISIQKNNFINVSLASLNLIGLKVTGPIDIKHNNFENCSLSIDNSTALLDISVGTLSKKGDLSAYLLLEENIFHNTKIRKKTSNVPTRSYFIRADLDRQKSTFTITKCSLGYPENEIFEDLTLMRISSLNVSITDTDFSGFKASKQDFGSLLEIEAASTLINQSSFSNLYFPHTSIPRDGLIAISSTGAQEAEIMMLNSEYMNISIGQMPLFSIMGLAKVNITDSSFSQIFWRDQLFSVGRTRNLIITFANSTLDLSGASNQSAPIGFTIQIPNANIIFRNSTIVLGPVMAGSLLKIVANEKRSVTFEDCLIVSAAQPSPVISLSAIREGPASKRLLDNSQHIASLNQSMRLLVSRGSIILSMRKCTINLHNVVSYPWIDLLSENTTIIIENSSFSNFVLISEYNSQEVKYLDYYKSLGCLTGIVTIVAETDTDARNNNKITLSVTATSFTNISSRRTGAISIINKLSSVPIDLLIDSSTFNNLTSDYGPAIALFQRDSNFSPNALRISNSSFTLTNASRLGGAIFNNMSQLTLDNSIFSGNYINSANNSIENALFTTNWNSSLFSSKMQGNPTYLQVTITAEADAGLNISQCEDKRLTCVFNASSHSLLKATISVTVLDHLSVPFPDLSDHAKLEVSINGITHTVQCEEGNCIINQTDLILYGDAGENIIMNLTYQNEYVALKNFTQFQLRACLPGEHHNTQKHTCDLCPPGEYSLDPEKPCQSCPEHANCTGGNDLSVDKGYWRNVSFDYIYKCNDAQSRCLGGYYSNCSLGYQGPLCLQCDYDKNYAADANTKGCRECPSDKFWLISGKVLVWLLSFAYSIYVLRSQKRQNKMIISDENSEAEARVKLKKALYTDLLVTYFQVISIVISFKGSFTDFISIFGGNTASSSGFWYSDICLLFISGYSGECPRCVLLIKVLGTPLIEWLLVCLIHLTFMYRFKFTWKRLRRFLLFLVTYFMLTYPSVCDTLLKFLFCSNFDIKNGGNYLLHDPNTSCDSEDYLTFRNYIAIPALVLWGLVFPGIFLFSITYWVKRNPQNVREIFGQLMNPYKENSYYWSAGVMMLKFGLVLCNNLADSDSKTRAWLMIIIIYLYKWLESYCNPYADQSVVKGVRLSLYAYLTTIFFTHYMQDSHVAIQTLSVMIILMMNAVGIGYILSFLITSAYTKVLGFIRKYVLKLFPGIEKPVRAGEKILFGEMNFMWDSTYEIPHPRSQTNYICRSESSEIELNGTIRRVETAL